MKYLKNVEQTLQVGHQALQGLREVQGNPPEVNDAATGQENDRDCLLHHEPEEGDQTESGPLQAQVFNSTFYLIGHCHMRNDVRIFTLDRIKMLHQTKKTFDMPEDFSFEDFVNPSFGVFQGAPTKVRIWFSAEAAGYVRENIWHQSRGSSMKKTGP